MMPSLLLVATAQVLNFSAQIAPWQASCAPLVAGQPASCGTPVAVAGVTPTVLDLSLTLAPMAGQASQTEQAFTSGAYSGLISLYSVYPDPSTGYPPYIQVRGVTSFDLRGI
jgi:hypothetical protein